jgi:non-lysosomal glucosylceramidase
MMPAKLPMSKDNDYLEEFHVDSSLPDWLQDMLVNSLSYWRTGFWVADGRWRQWETFDCNDVDSVHNDFQRELPYIIFFPGK